MSTPSHNRKLTQYCKQDGACWLCSQPLDLFQPIGAWGSASWEHVIPKVLGGSDHMTNLVLTHWECNKARGDRFVFSLSRPTSHREMVELQSPKRGQHAGEIIIERATGRQITHKEFASRMRAEMGKEVKP